MTKISSILWGLDKELNGIINQIQKNYYTKILR